MSNRRQVRLKRHPLEIKYLGLVLMAMLGPTLLATGCLYYIIWQSVAHQLALPELIAESLMPAYQQVNQIILLGMPIIFVLFLVSAIRLTHRLAGPLERLERDLDDKIKTGNFTKPLHVRKRDALYGLVDKINHAIRSSRHQ